MLKSALPRSRMGKPYRDSLMSSWIVFGGEDQRQALMASRQQKRQPRTTTNIVVRNGTAANQAGPSRANRARRRRNRRKPQQTVVRVLSNKGQGRRRIPRSQGLGNRVVIQRIVTTLGTVGANGSGQIETELAVLLNPSTMKEATGSNNYGPVQIYASTYSLFQIRSLRLHLKPLVGSSAVSGTVVRTSWNPTNNPTQTSWSALGARKHSDVTPGRDGRFTLTARDLAGPKDGWYRTNTKGEPMLSFAGSLEIHTFGETRSTYQNGKYTGSLFLAELEVVWAFKDYSQQPGLMNLIKGDSTGDATVSTDASGKLILTTPATSELARAAATTTASEIIWMVTDAVIQGAAVAFPPPFSWLLRGGWWFLKRIAGAPTRSGVETFEIYSSINDARAGVPCIADTANQRGINIGQLHFQQITPGNTGVSTGIPQTRQLLERFYPHDKIFVPISTKRLKFNRFPNEWVPGFDVWYHPQDGVQNPQTGIAFYADGQARATYNIMEVTLSEQVDVDAFESKVSIYLKTQPDQQPSMQNLVGIAVAKSSSTLQGNDTWRVDTFLVYCTREVKNNFEGRWKGSAMRYPVDGTYNARLTIPTDSTQGFIRVTMEPGRWYAVQYTCFSTSADPITQKLECGGDVVGVFPSRTLTTGNHTFPVTDFDGDSSLVPVYGAGIAFTPFKSNEVNIVPANSTSRQLISYDLEPTFGCDDAFEFPPPPAEDGSAEDEDEFEDPEEPETSNHFDFSSDLDDDGDLEMGPDDHYSDPPLSRLVVREEARAIYEQLRATHSERAARLAANQLYPSDEYTEFIEVYHDALADGLSPKEARAQALGF
uniref:ORF2 n=1 Tax=Porcine astrovirus 2/BEL/15V010 TaxID=2017723 RepID=A0A221LEB1_9VIRU|nr:ORF2 [Porcine astrovirus 2/BEL/15V010]